MQTSSVGRQRKYSDVVEEDEAAGGSGSESSRRSQRYNGPLFFNPPLTSASKCYVRFHLGRRVTH